MSDILIRGMEMPTYEQGDLVLRVRWDGRVDKDYSGNTVATAVPVPPHGDLIEREALMDDIIGSMVFSGREVPKEAAIVQKVMDIVGDANAIIEAEKEEQE